MFYNYVFNVVDVSLEYTYSNKFLPLSTKITRRIMKYTVNINNYVESVESE